MSWWKPRQKIQPRPTRQTNYPSDLFIEVENGSVFYIKRGTKFKVYSKRVLESWNAPICRGSEASLSKYLKGAPLGFRNGTLINNIANGKMYLVSENKTRHIVSPDVFEKYGLNENNVIRVSSAETNLHQEGEPLA